MIIMRLAWLLLSGVTFVHANSCSERFKETEKCYDSVVFYESISFPLYGHNESSLDDTCGDIHSSLACIKEYYNDCKDSPECDDNCTEAIQHIGPFLKNTGLERFATDLCEFNNPLRQTYLDNVDCLMMNADEYAKCHNDSQMSLSYISTLGSVGINERCCYSSWYNSCFTNATTRACGENATIFVSYGIHQLVGDMMSTFCAKTQISCDRPPLPSDEELDHNKPDQTENEIDTNSLNSAVVQLSVTGVILMSYFSVILSTQIL